MAFIDEISFRLKAGNGGNGVVRWLHEKGKDFAGAAGGNGGNGGSVLMRGVRDIGVLAKYRHKKEFSAERGIDGMKKSMFGRNGEDLILDVPIGSVITNRTTGDEYQILKENETVFLLKGGRGGFGNEHFKGSKNVSPYQSTDGTPGEEGDFDIELQLLVDAGLAGFPNAGKSSLINVITNASAKVGSYQFTTLEPNLGAFYGYILADIPGLIEGAADGKGLGHKFLRHIKRTKLVLHCISLEHYAEDPKKGIEKAYKTIRAELEAYDSILAEKSEVIILTKSDMVDAAGLKAALTQAKKLAGKGGNVLTVSIYDDASIKTFSDSLIKILRAE